MTQNSTSHPPSAQKKDSRGTLQKNGLIFSYYIAFTLYYIILQTRVTSLLAASWCHLVYSFFNVFLILKSFCGLN